MNINEMVFYTYKNLIGYTGPIREKIDIIRLLLNILNVNILKEEKQHADITIVFQNENRSNRVFIYEDEKKQIQSFHNPFIFESNGSEINIRLEKEFFHEKIDAATISILTSFFNEYSDCDNKFDIFFDMFLNLTSDCISDTQCNEYWNLILYLLSFEPCYLRYDFDLTNENGDIHPRNHLDINYNSNGTYKIGLHNNIDTEYLIDMISKETKCKFIEL